MKSAIFLIGILVTAGVFGQDSMPSRHQTIVQVDSFYLTTWNNSPVWEIECDYRIGDGEWRHAKASGTSDKEIRLPGSSVHIVLDANWVAIPIYECDVASVVFTNDKAPLTPTHILIHQ